MKEAVGGVIELKEGIQNISIAFSGSIALVVIIVIVLWCFFYKEKQICCKGSGESVVSYWMQPAASFLPDHPDVYLPANTCPPAQCSGP